MEDTSSNGAAAREAVVKELAALHRDEETVYTGCVVNCGAGHCILKVRRRDGAITAIEPDDHYNRNVGREDTVVSEIDLVKNRLQFRACPMGFVFHKLATAPERILYPLKKVAGTGRMEGKFERISWDEALDLLAGKMKEMVEKYGPYSVTTPYQPNPAWERLFGLWGAGVEGWGWCSWDSGRLSMHLMTGVPDWVHQDASNNMVDTLLNTRLIVLWGFEPTIQHFGPGHQLAFFLKMARERGVPVICFDPRYTVAAEFLADQWIPVKPGTDAAMMNAIANVVVKEGLYDREFVEQHVDPKGFEEWRAYFMGESDGVEKTPEWAEQICGVPAETIRAFAHLYASKKPTWLWLGWGPPRKSRGENVIRAAVGLQALMGYFGVPGGSVPFHMGTRTKPAPMHPYGDLPGHPVPKMYRSYMWAKAVLLLDKVQSGEMSVDEYKAMVGWRAPNHLPLPNPKLLVGGSTWLHNTRVLDNAADATSDHIKAMERMEFICFMHTTLSPALYPADLILPVADQCLEDRRIWGGGNPGYGGAVNITYVPGVTAPRGEARPGHWIYSEIAKRLGIGEQYNRYYQGGDWGDGSAWWQAWEVYLQHEYDRTVKELRQRGAEPPDWETFKQSGLLNVQELDEEPYHGYADFVQGGKPLKTRTGKIEIYNYAIGDESKRGENHVDNLGRMLNNLPNDWRDLPPIPIYQPAYRGMDHADLKQFPLFMLTAYTRYRNHSTFWNVPWLRGDCYRHACWLSTVDAQQRGLEDGDLVRIWNDKGVGVIPAYVTSRILPGMIVIHHGGWHTPDEEGVDWGCTPNIFLTDPESPVTPGLVSNAVLVEKYVGPRRKPVAPEIVAAGGVQI